MPLTQPPDSRRLANAAGSADVGGDGDCIWARIFFTGLRAKNSSNLIAPKGIRALRGSGDFDDYWQFHLAKEHERNHASRYADGVVPDPFPQPKPNLRVVN